MRLSETRHKPPIAFQGTYHFVSVLQKEDKAFTLKLNKIFSLTDSRKLPQQVLEPPSNGKIEYLEAPV
ncbi:MAG: hypothetical protein K2X66_13565, partial [Cyanobacteria bacterium]|nr:hypothetical protein [Cyanobacteriota bacterium]